MISGICLYQTRARRRYVLKIVAAVIKSFNISNTLLKKEMLEEIQCAMLYILIANSLDIQKNKWNTPAIIMETSKRSKILKLEQYLKRTEHESVMEGVTTSMRNMEDKYGMEINEMERTVVYIDVS